MAFKDLFKTKAERRAYAVGRRHQYNKEHPLTRFAVEAVHYSFNKDGTRNGTPYSVLGSRHKTASEAKQACKEANEKAKYRKERVLEAVRNKKVNVFSSQDSGYTEYRVVKKKERL